MNKDLGGGAPATPKLRRRKHSNEVGFYYCSAIYCNFPTCIGAGALLAFLSNTLFICDLSLLGFHILLINFSLADSF